MSYNENKTNHAQEVIKDHILKNEIYEYGNLKWICHRNECHCDDCDMKLALQRLCHEQVLWKFGPEFVFKALIGVEVQAVW